MSREVHVRFREGAGVRLPRATRLAVLCNGTKGQAEAMREELYTFLKTRLRLELSKEKTKITHANDGFIPNPYLTLGKKLSREALLEETYWTGYEYRPGMADLRPQILKRDQYTCQRCGTAVTTATGEVDHIKPVRRFKRPIDANVPENLWMLCRPCHAAKTQQDRQVESRMRGERAGPVRRRA